MTRKRGRPAPDEVRCPTCHSVAWRRVGERVTEASSGRGRPDLDHEFVRDKGPWDWTCQRCGYSVRPAGSLDNALSRVQPTGLPAILAGLFGVGDRSARGANSTAVSTAQAVALGAVGVVLVVVAATVLGGAPSTAPVADPRTPVPVTPVSAASAEVVTSLGDIVGARDATLAGRRVELTDVQVESVTGDVTLWIGSEGERAFVVLDEERQPERAVTVRPGQRLVIRGTALRAPPEDVELSTADRNAVEDVSLYVLAEHVEIVSE